MTILSRPGNGRLGRLSHVLRPMISGFPMVIVLKNRRSDESRHGNLPSRPITPFLDTATTKAILGRIWFSRPSPGDECSPPLVGGAGGGCHCSRPHPAFASASASLPTRGRVCNSDITPPPAQQYADGFDNLRFRNPRTENRR